jgi:hypothetical protein
VISYFTKSFLFASMQQNVLFGEEFEDKNAAMV